MKHYVYKLEDKKTKEFYFGSRTCKCEINEDDYMGSMKTWKPNKNDLVKIIIKSDFKTRIDAIDYEKKKITETYKNVLNRNYSIPNTGFYSGGEPETNPNYGKKWNNNSKQKHSKLMKEYYKIHSAPNKNRKFSEEWRKNISKGRIKFGTAKGENNGNFGKGKAILQYDLEENLIKEWISGHTAAKELGVNKENIYRCLQGIQKTSCRSIWKYKL